jgi:hypothetical protein
MTKRSAPPLDLSVFSLEPLTDSRSLRRFYVGNCLFSFVCTKRWADLTEVTGPTDRRFCSTCKKDVYLCRTQEEFAARGRAGECVAIRDVEGHGTESDGDILSGDFPDDSKEILGRPIVPEDDEDFK